ncbi:MAG: TrmH family RNA methyltransferase, partial [Cytophagales bacterium]|nr:TrmH family RNA methyltransferase [Cytophagales bacterium]
IWLQDIQYPKGDKYCFIFGNEVFGVSDEVINICESSIEIPQFGTKHSFNVSVSTGIVLWDYFLKTRS